jgi:hypothetical protein
MTMDLCVAVNKNDTKLFLNNLNVNENKNQKKKNNVLKALIVKKH